MSKSRLVTTVDSSALVKFRGIARTLKISDAALLRDIVMQYLSGQSQEVHAVGQRTSHKFVEEPGTVQCVLGIDTLNRIDIASKKQGMTRDTFLKSALLERLEEGNLRLPSIRELDPDEGLKQITVRVPNFLIGRMKRRARQMQMKVSPWISNLIQSTLVREPVMTHNQIVLLNTSIRELNSIGRNLNQIAKAMNQNLNHTSEVNAKELEAVKNALFVNKAAIMDLVAVSQRNWSVFLD